MKNKVITGDCLEVMRGMDAESVDLVATDPPFNTGRDFGAYLDAWEFGAVREAEYSELGVDAQVAVDAAYRLHSESMAAFCCFLGVRLVEMHRILKPSGSIYLHCDQTANSYIRLMMDAVFGSANFRNQITWCYRGMGANASKFQQKHDNILFYARDLKHGNYFDAPRGEPTPESMRTYESGRRIGYIANHSRMMASVFDWDKYNAAVREGKIPKGMRATEFKDGKPRMVDWWSDIKILGGPNNKERVGYPTQKPIALYSRIIQASCPEKGWVLDPFAGSGTTLVAAQRLGRRAIAIDVNPQSQQIIEERLK